jgi:hypothetical protein
VAPGPRFSSHWWFEVDAGSVVEMKCEHKVLKPCSMTTGLRRRAGMRYVDESEVMVAGARFVRASKARVSLATY